eukprot:CAMPEP_0171410572 /NCGR_PEP_ID=MMETSP0880-20121228/27779_1 /TAXON_ID=67004 /ORGANISM="Thalassiosira weissflogii, Strain CCMP1336" /LENGTH=36 /DNA_ID= /DNA_START= /DNA_END= /DNA_ORIENTATION=
MAVVALLLVLLLIVDAGEGAALDPLLAASADEKWQE